VSRRRQTVRGFAWQLLMIGLLIVAFFAFLNSDLPSQLGRVMASGMTFGHTRTP
jgi:hypothetical protein